MSHHDQDLINLATEHLSIFADVHAFERRGLYLYRDDATSAWWVVDADDMGQLGEMLRQEIPDAYSHWCTTSDGREVDPERIVRAFDANTDLDALQAEAGAADDMVTYMALRFLRDDIEQVVEQNAEIAAEALVIAANPFPTVRRVSGWRAILEIAANIAPEPDPRDLAAEVANMGGTSRAADVAFFAFELARVSNIEAPRACAV